MVKKLEQVAWKDCRIFLLGSTQNLMRHGAEQPVVADSASFGGLDQMSISVQLFKQSEN